MLKTLKMIFVSLQKMSVVIVMKKATKLLTTKIPWKPCGQLLTMPFWDGGIALVERGESFVKKIILCTVLASFKFSNECALIMW